MAEIIIEQEPIIEVIVQESDGSLIQNGYEDVILLNGGDTYQLTAQPTGKSYIIMIDTPNPIPTIVLPPVGPPIHVFGPNQPKFTYIRVLYILNQWIKL